MSDVVMIVAPITCVRKLRIIRNPAYSASRKDTLTPDDTGICETVLGPKLEPNRNTMSAQSQSSEQVSSELHVQAQNSTTMAEKRSPWERALSTVILSRCWRMERFIGGVITTIKRRAIHV
ncbi:hypothetical protein BV898_19653 [Hypsibius exemplaris]|uniref:Uncharacterized protein n=1 Tax=Hypsibius exemplaris TaxID=2072580 RepID=A0A9X6RPN0_HYPEX|nr:hypothetical protein BV898_19653 [Hypsibius exemplaris]